VCTQHKSNRTRPDHFFLPPQIKREKAIWPHVHETNMRFSAYVAIILCTYEINNKLTQPQALAPMTCSIVTSLGMKVRCVCEPDRTLYSNTTRKKGYNHAILLCYFPLCCLEGNRVTNISSRVHNKANCLQDFKILRFQSKFHRFQDFAKISKILSFEICNPSYCRQ